MGVGTVQEWGSDWLVFLTIFTPQTLKDCILLIFHPFWAIQTGVGALSTHEDFIFRPYVERRRFEWEGGEWDTFWK
jgi:hypothetical protein